MKPLASVGPVLAENLVFHAAILERELVAELARLDRDAAQLDSRGYPRFAADVRELRGRLAKLLDTTHAVVSTPWNW